MLSLTVGSGKQNASDYFLGDIRYMEFGASSGNGTYISYNINKNATFIANLNKADTDTVVQKNKGLALKDGAKAILSFHQGFNNTLNFEQIANSGGTLTLTTSTNTDSNLLLNSDKLSGTVLDIASLADNASTNDYNHDIKTIYQRRTTGRTLSFASVKFEGSGSGIPLVRLFAGENETEKYADKIKITSLDATQTDTAKNINTQIFLAPQLIGEDLTSAGLEVFEAPSEVRLENKEAITDDIVYTVEIIEDSTSKTGTSVWKIGNTSKGSIVNNTAEYLASALSVNYSLFVQNINSLNKRMGELRGDDKSQGVWARVFTGKQTSTMDFIPVDTYYTTVQGGYDYGFNVDGAKNYLGFSLAYNNGQSDSSKDLSSLSISEFKATTNTIDFGIYNSYIQDEGWFSDTIMKLSYFMSSFDITQAKGNITTQVNNFGFTLGEEFGYRFALGETKEWFIDPQAEFVLGYLSSSNLVDGATTANIQDTLLFRSRIGSDFGYALKIDGNQYDFRLGMSYEYDVANGSVDITNTLGNKTYTRLIDNAIENDGRVVLNIGTNMSFKNNMRVYFDFEKSFVGKIQTDYQVNLGFRYSFGETTQTSQKQKDVLPLKIDDDKQTTDTQEKIQE